MEAAHLGPENPPQSAGGNRQTHTRHDGLPGDGSGTVFLFDENALFIAASAAGEALLRDAADLCGKRADEVFSEQIDPQWSLELAGRLERALQGEAPPQTDDVLRFDDGRTLYMRVRIAPAAFEGHTGAGVWMEDVTDLVEAARKAEDDSRAKSNFLANMSHEIRTPMNAIKGLSELLSRTSLTELQHSYVGTIINSANSLLEIINDILDFSKISANKLELVEGPYSVAQLLADVVGTNSLKAEEKGLALVVEADPAIPATLNGDPVRVKQVFTNILSNAVKYTDKGYIRFTIRAHEQMGGCFLEGAIEDSGRGIREEDLSTLFESFSRVDLHTNQGITGTGLGLAISRQLARAMGGEIEVESEYGRGSVFKFWIPQLIVDARPMAAVEQPEAHRVLLLGNALRMESVEAMLGELGVENCFIPAGEPLAGQGYEYTECIYDEDYCEEEIEKLRAGAAGCHFAVLMGMQNALKMEGRSDTVIFNPMLVTDLARLLNGGAQQADAPARGEEPLPSVQGRPVLVVDDNQVNLMVAGEMLGAFDAEVTCADSGEEAIHLCNGQKYDIIFMDHMMPGMDGIEAAGKIRGGGGPNSGTPIVALTANVVNNMREFYMANGMDDFIGKPIEFEDLSRVLRRWIPAGKKI